MIKDNAVYMLLLGLSQVLCHYKFVLERNSSTKSMKLKTKILQNYAPILSQWITKMVSFQIIWFVTVAFKFENHLSATALLNGTGMLI